MSDAVFTTLQTLAGADLSVGVSGVAGEDGLIEPEPDAVAGAVPTRRAEFAAGRRAARLALDAFGAGMRAIPQGAARAPVWPDGTLGSISHDAGLAIACAGRTKDWSGVGIDLAEASDFPAHLRDRILLTPAEMHQSGLEARLTFSAKEAVFKAFYPSVGAFFGFGAVEVASDLSAGQFTVRLRQSLGATPEGSVFKGRCAITEGRLMALLTLPA